MKSRLSNRIRLMLVFVLFLALPGVLHADIVYLEKGGKVEGKIIKKDSDGVVKIKTIYGVVEIQEDNIERIEKCESVFDLYERKLKETPKDDSEARFRLAEWCREKKLKTEAKKHLKEVIALSPDHEKARTELGYEKTDKGWQKKASVKKKKTASTTAKKEKSKSRKLARKKKKKKKSSKPAKPVVKTIRAGCNVYLLWCTKTKEAAVIDAGGGASEVFQLIEQNKLKLTKIIITHGHGDHVAALSSISGRAKNAEVLAHEKAPVRGATRKVKEGDTIKVGTLTLKVLHTPGHTPGSMCLYIKSGKILFSGDTLFKNGLGRTRSASDRQMIIKMIKEKLFVLPDDVVVYPGHNESTTIGAEKKHAR